MEHYRSCNLVYSGNVPFATYVISKYSDLSEDVHLDMIIIRFDYCHDDINNNGGHVIFKKLRFSFTLFSNSNALLWPGPLLLTFFLTYKTKQKVFIRFWRVATDEV